MADSVVRYRSPLADQITAGRHGRTSGDAGVHIREITEFAALAIIARKGRAADVAAVLSRHIGGDVPDAPKRVAAGSLAVAGAAPGQWLVISRTVGSDASLNGLCGALSGLAAVTDQGDGRVIFEVAGERVREALAKGIAVDLDPSAFKIGDVAHTSVAHIGVQISLVNEGPTFEIISARSTAGNIWSWLMASAGEFGIEVA